MWWDMDHVNNKTLHEFLDNSSCANPPPLPGASPVARCRLSTLRCIAQLHSIRLITQYGGGTDIICFLSALLATGRWLELSAAWSGQFLIVVQVCWRCMNSHPALPGIHVGQSFIGEQLVGFMSFNNIKGHIYLKLCRNLYFYRFYECVCVLLQTVIWCLFFCLVLTSAWIKKPT